MNKNFKNNRAYGIGFNDGYQKGIDECEEELIDVKTQLQEERVINQKIQADADKAKADADKAKADADKAKADADKAKADADKAKADAKEQAERIDELEVTVDNVLDVLNGLQTEYDSNTSEMEAIMVKRETLESENKEIDLIVPGYIDVTKIKSPNVKKTVMGLICTKESNNSEIKRGERDFTKLQKKNVGINSTINNFKVKNFDKIVEAVNNLTA